MHIYLCTYYYFSIVLSSTNILQLLILFTGTKSLRMKREIQSQKDDKNQCQKQTKISKKLPLDEVFPLRKHLPRSLHKRVKVDFNVRPACAYCAWNYQNSQTLSNTMTYSKAVSRISLLCYYCNMYLYKKCFDCFHDTTGMLPL